MGKSSRVSYQCSVKVDVYISFLDSEFGTLFVLRGELARACRERYVELRAQAHQARVVLQEVCWQAVFKGLFIVVRFLDRC